MLVMKKILVVVLAGLAAMLVSCEAAEQSAPDNNADAVVLLEAKIAELEA